MFLTSPSYRIGRGSIHTPYLSHHSIFFGRVDLGLVEVGISRPWMQRQRVAFHAACRRENGDACTAFDVAQMPEPSFSAPHPHASKGMDARVVISASDTSYIFLVLTTPFTFHRVD